MKRVLDIIASFFAIIVLFPVFIAVALIVLVSDGAPVVYKQKPVPPAITKMMTIPHNQLIC